MTPSDYIKNAIKTEPKKYNFLSSKKVSPRIEHAIFGTVTESGELMDQLKKIKIYGKEFDREHLIEDTGDLMWYIALLCDELDVSFEEIWERNLKKLKARYSNGFSTKEALGVDTTSKKL